MLTEAVANAWDADAENVEIGIDPDGMFIKIKDDGIGMSNEDMNTKYLRVGYRRRDEERETGRTTAKGPTFVKIVVTLFMLQVSLLELLLAPLACPDSGIRPRPCSSFRQRRPAFRVPSFCRLVNHLSLGQDGSVSPR